MKQHKRKRKKRLPLAAGPALAPTAVHENPPDEEKKVRSGLMEAFESISFQDASSAYEEANGDVNMASEMLAKMVDDVADDPTTSSVSSGIFSSDSCSRSGSSVADSSSGSWEGALEANVMSRGKGFRGSNKHKGVVAVTGTVSTMLGKDYVKANRGKNTSKGKEFGNSAYAMEDAEQFLCSMLGDDCDLGMDVVKDVLCQCGYDVEKALDFLFDLTGSSKRSGNNRYLKDSVNYEDDPKFLNEHNLTNSTFDSLSHSTEPGSELDEGIWGSGCRSYWQALLETPSPTSSTSNESNLPQKVLESLFKIPKSSVHEQSSMNWRNVAKKMQSLGPGVNDHPSFDTFPQLDTCGTLAEGQEYNLFRKSANQHWESMKSYYHKAAVAYSKGECNHASYLSDQAKAQSKLARVADEKASQHIFQARNKGIENVITIDLHGQHVKEAMRVLKLHLLFGTYVQSIQTLRVITGCGSHGLGKSKLKQSIIKLLEKEGIKWSEENRGTLLIKLEGFKEYSFLDSESDSD